jgi:sterol desaturase/sphingolipid hydroxylase (fatty acid hydroxylase superfamily)
LIRYGYFSFHYYRIDYLYRMSPSFLEYAHVILSNQHWYMNHLLPEHLIRIVWCLILMGIYALVELDYLPGKQWKIRRDLHTTPQEIGYYIKSSFLNMLKWHIGPLILYEILFYRPNLYVYEAPTWWTLVWKSVGYTIVFDMATHSFHHVTHLHPRVASFFHREHAKHHASCGRYIYPWNGFYSSAFESFAGLVFFLGAMIPFQIDPVTRLVSILFIHFVATNNHSGYDFPWMFHNWNPVGRFAWHGSVGHYYHHQLGRKNLSTFWTFLDRWCNTYYDYTSHPPSHPNEFIYRRQVAKFISNIEWVQ